MRSSNARRDYSAAFENGTFVTHSHGVRKVNSAGSPALGAHSVDFRRFSCRKTREARAGTARAQLKIVVG